MINLLSLKFDVLKGHDRLIGIIAIKRRKILCMETEYLRFENKTVHNTMNIFAPYLTTPCYFCSRLA